MILLSIDPGTINMGWAVFKSSILLAHGVHNYKGPYSGKKLSAIANSLCELFKTYTPDELVVENYFTQSNAKGAGVVSELRGLIRYMWAFYSDGKEMHEVHPGTVKKQCTGDGGCSKEQLKSWVEGYYNITIKVQDEGDSVAQGHTWLKLQATKE